MKPLRKITIDLDALVFGRCPKGKEQQNINCAICGKPGKYKDMITGKFSR